MIPADHTPDEPARLDALRRLAVLDTAEEATFDALARTASTLCETPIALVSLVDADRQWFKAAVGLPAGVRETPREQSFCAHAIHGTDVLEVPDATLDARFHDNPLVTGAPHIRFYAGAPLVDAAGHGLGTLCVIDRVPRRLAQHQRDALAALAQATAALLQARRARVDLTRLQARTQEEIDSARRTVEHAAWRDQRARRHVQTLELPAQQFSGDIVAAAFTPDGALRGLLADATGHGLAAALNVLPVVDAFYTMTEKGLPLGAVAAEINRKLHRLLPTGNFVALGLAEIRGGTIRVWNGGLPPVLVLDPDGRVRHRYASRNCPAGVLGPAAFDETVDAWPLLPGGQVLMHSDGLSEVHDPHGRLLTDAAIARALRGVPASGRCAALKTLALDHLGGGQHHDDISVLVLSPPTPVAARTQRRDGRRAEDDHARERA